MDELRRDPAGRDRVLAGRLIDGRAVEVGIEGGAIVRVSEVDDAPDRLIVPGLVDLQVNGYRGHDLNASGVAVETVWELVRELRRAGTTAFCPTVITAEPAAIVHALQAIASACRLDEATRHAIVGIHVEGPYISSSEGARGAHDVSAMRDPDPAELERWVAAAEGLLRIVTIAPEREGALDYIRAAVATGIQVAVGHCAASTTQIHAAAEAGATLSTHLGNGVAPTLPRHPNLLWAQLADDRLTAGLIGDGQHLSADTFLTMVRAKGPGRAFLVSDSAALAGSAEGVYRTPVGGSVRVTANQRLELTDTGLLAGSGASLAECVRWAAGLESVGVARAVDMATRVPADLLGRQDRGRLAPGCAGDVAVLSPDLRVEAVVVAGALVG